MDGWPTLKVIFLVYALIKRYIYVGTSDFDFIDENLSILKVF